MKLVQLAEAGDVAGVLRELGALTPVERAAQTEALAARRATAQPNWPYMSEEERAAQLAAELGCRTDPEAAADWIAKNCQQEATNVPLEGAWVVEAVNLHPVAWRAELAARLAERPRPPARLVEHLVRETGCPVPTSTGFVAGWLHSRIWPWHPVHLRGGPQPGATLLAQLRQDDLSPKLLPLAVERPEISLGPNWFHNDMTEYGPSQMMEHSRLGAFISLSAEGRVDRAALIRHVFAGLDINEEPPDVAVMMTAFDLTPEELASVAGERAALAESLRARLLQDGTRRETAPTLAYLRALALTPAENAPFVRDHVALLDLSPPVADYAQGVVNGLDEAGLLEPDLLTEACERLLLRPEKKLVRAQLTRLDRAARRDPARAARAVLDAATAFDHRDIDVQERALDVVARHIGAAGDSVLPELRTAAERISPGLAPRAADLLGTVRIDATRLGSAPDRLAAPYAEVLPAVPEPRPVPGPVGTAAEVAEELAAVVANNKDVVTFERVLDGLVRHAHLDRAALARALRPVMRKRPRDTSDCTQSDVYDVAAALRGDEPREYDIIARLGSEYSSFSPAGTLLGARLAEAAGIIEAGVQPFLLAVPTDATGALDAAELVRRISALDGLGVAPAPVDLAQALLRATPTTDAEVLRAAGELGSDAGRRLAQWLCEGGLPHPDPVPADWADVHPDDHPDKHPTYWVNHLGPEPATGPPLLPAAAALVGPYDDCRGITDPMAPFWLAQLPHHRDVVLARDYFRRRHGSDRGWAHALPFAAESGGPAGFALHLALARTLAYDRQTEREATVDALLVLAARGQLDTGLLGRQLAELLRDATVEANRVTASLRTAAETGAYATIWAVLESALPHLLRDHPVHRGAGALLALGVDCASHCAPKSEIPEVTKLAARPGSSQAAKNARLLRDVLG
ncbi:DUF6493 family protein [Streptomyces sp. CWNU-52B]|uniref:DUF6493 family protein n=1 Tax=unclassified Streptomyces TaxID=2593676 RepID=UPI0039BF98DB